MPLIEWSATLELGVAQIDSQHQELVAAINDLHEGMKQRKSIETVAEIVTNLADYVVYHFGAEERLMDERGYPGAAVHKVLHGEFSKKLDTFRQGVRCGKLLLSMEVMEFLKDWLTHHILKVDREFAAFLQARNAR